MIYRSCGHKGVRELRHNNIVDLYTLDNLGHTADMVGMGVGGDYVIKLFDGVRLEIIEYRLIVAALTRIYQHGVVAALD